MDDSEGSIQIHVFPTVLVIDERASQVFLGFESDWPALIRRLGHRYPPGTPCFTGENWVPLGEAAPCGRLVIGVTRADHPGGVEGLVWVVDRLLGPGGCPWDKEQTHESLKKYLLEESYELFQAIDQGDLESMKEELGDVLLQPLMHTQISQRDGGWGADEVAAAITEKLIRRHPHVFGEATAETPEEVLLNWDAIKQSEKGEPRSLLAGVPLAMPALLRAMEVSKRAARAGFEWPDFDAVWEKFDEETGEVRAALASGDRQRVSEEIGDLLFTVVNLARWAKIDAEESLRAMVDRFTERFMKMESLAELSLGELSAEEWDRLWNLAKSDQS